MNVAAGEIGSARVFSPAVSSDRRYEMSCLAEVLISILGQRAARTDAKQALVVLTRTKRKPST
jgi:hypothetical protein